MKFGAGFEPRRRFERTRFRADRPFSLTDKLSFPMRFSTFSLLRRGVWRRSAFLWLGVSTLTVAAALAQESREWRDSAGRPIATSTNEKLVGTLRLDGVDDPGKVRIKMGGKTFRFTLANLSEADREYVEAERAKKNAPQTASNPTADASTTESNSTAAQPTRTNVPNPAPALAEDASRALVAIPKDGVKRALLVGVDDYAEFADLKYAVADVEAIRERLIGLGFKPENIVELKSTNPANLRPSQRYIRRQVDALLKAAGPNDLLFLHFSGHGFQTDGVVRFAPDDAVATGDENVLDPETTISLTEIIERLKTSEAKFKWLIVDACRENPTGTRSAAANARALKNIDPNKGVLVLQSCAEGELSFEDADAGRGLFTGRLLEAFDGKADFDGDGQMSALDVCKYVSEQTLAASQTRFNATQTPYFSGEFADFIVAEDLKVDGLTREDWEQAETLYDAALQLTETEDYETAQKKIDAALEIVADVPDANDEKRDYVQLKMFIERLLPAETPAEPQPVVAPRPETPGSAFKWSVGANGATLCGFKYEKLENIVIPSKVDGKPVVAICKSAFSRCDALQSVSFPDGLQTIGDSAFSSCAALQSVSFPDGLRTIGKHAFSSCAALESVSFPDGLRMIGDYAFWGCDALESVSFPDDLRTIGELSFYECAALQSVSFPDGLQTIGDSAFYGCDALESVSFPDGLQTIGKGAFSNCKALQSFSASATHPTFRVVDGVLFSADGKTLVAYPGGRKAETYRVPDGLKTIGDSAFSNCAALESVLFPDGLRTIGDSAFWGCDALESVSFPDGLKTIGEHAFSFCDALESVELPRETKSSKYAFPRDCEVRVR